MKHTTRFAFLNRIQLYNRRSFKVIIFLTPAINTIITWTKTKKKKKNINFTKNCAAVN
jgi:ribosomal protein L34E